MDNHNQSARLSKTLPKDFTFHPDGAPRTPERPTEQVNVPPVPNHASCRFRRPRLDILSTFEAKSMTFGSPDVALPSIEVPDGPDVASSSLPGQTFLDAPPQVDDHLQVPPRERMDFRTPPAQIRDVASGMPSDPTNERDLENAASISRPSSACSNISNSSGSSCESYLSRPSFGGSCTSPESEIQDPFVTASNSNKKDHQLLAPANVDGAYDMAAPQSPSFDAHTTESHRWTSDMDNHLWNTYQTYLQNPMITPFKTVPGSIPPLGVSHRVAREARKTWPRARRASPLPMGSGKRKLRPRRSPLPPPRRDVTPANNPPAAPAVDPAAGGRSGSTTPTAACSPPPSSSSKRKTATTKKNQSWPRSNASTRRRLKHLCKKRFSMAPHYQRLLQSRSPSPFIEGRAGPASSSRAVPPSSSHGQAASFTRDLGVSLVATSLPTSVRGSSVSAEANPGDNTPIADQGNNNDSPSETGQSILPSIEFPRSDDTLPPSSDNFAGQLNNMRRLGSPFVYHTWGPDKLHRRRNPSAPTTRSHNRNHAGTMHVTGVRLRSPIPEDMFSGSHKHKRRALSQAQDDSDDNNRDSSSLDARFGQDLPELLQGSGNKNALNRRIRLRNRGATTGAISSRERLLQLFTPPSQMGSGGENNDNGNNNHNSNSLSIPSSSHHNSDNGDTQTIQAHDAKRLGSPFCLSGFSRHAPSRSESFAAGGQYGQLGESILHLPQHGADGNAPYPITEGGQPAVGRTSSIERTTPFH